MPASSSSFQRREHDVLFQLEVGDAVDQQAADAVVAVVDDGPGSRGGAAARRRRGPPGPAPMMPTDSAVPRAGSTGLTQPRVEGGVGDVALDRADGDALEALLDDAVALAQPVLRADAAADLGEVVGGGGRPRRLPPAGPRRSASASRGCCSTAGNAPSRTARRTGCSGWTGSRPRSRRSRGRSRRSPRAARRPRAWSAYCWGRWTNCSMRSAMARLPWRGGVGRVGTATGRGRARLGHACRSRRHRSSATPVQSFSPCTLYGFPRLRECKNCGWDSMTAMKRAEFSAPGKSPCTSLRR